jgi:hypothetical protein
MNRLQYEESPYLQQHKNNPVDWYPWGKEAFEKAKKEDKPILVSIGYSTCHWCHVMEKESFENPETADIMNEHFINIKVDREELPAVDQYYMDAVQVLSGSGGWPLNCFLTPDRKPYFGGTYYPPIDQRGRPSWKKVLRRMSAAYHKRREEVLEQADKLSKLVEEGSERFIDHKVEFTESHSFDIASWIKKIKGELDFKKGGLNRAPKFPSPQLYQFLLQYGLLENDEDVLEAVKRTAHAFVDGGLFDPVHGGFARYCVDENWRVPHFEKMLYDNAGILSLLAQLQSFHPDDRWLWAINRTLGFWSNEMRSDKGLFYSAVDADSEGVEGKYYTWTKDELKSVLNEDEYEIIDTYADLKEQGNWEGSNILYTDPERRAHFFKGYTETDLNGCLDKLREAAKERVKPGVDEKQLLDWNAMMVMALVHLHKYAGIKRAGEMAKEIMEVLLNTFVKNGQIKGHVYKNDKVYASATLDDYAYLIASLIELYEWTLEMEYLDIAKELGQKAFQLFGVKDQVLFMMSAVDSKEVVGRQPNYFDNAYPSGNSIMADNLRKLGKIFDMPEWTEHSYKMMLAIEDSVSKYPTAFNRWAGLGLAFEYLDAEIAIMGDKYEEWGRKILAGTLPGPVFVGSSTPKENLPLLNRQVQENQTAIFLCQNYTCQKPVYSLNEFSNLRSDTLHH